jgi:CheY-like chemotaxis protein
VDQVLLNLCINARDAVDGSGAVRVFARTIEAEGLVCSSCRASVEGHFVEMGVEDDGHGITPDVLERIFEPFFSTKEPGKGTGMGLAMVHGIVHELGGHVVVDSEPGRGSRFRVLWPALPAEETDASIQAAREAPEPQRARPTLRGSVLVVDDEQDVGNFMRELLETWGLDAEFVTEAQTALDLITSHPGRFDAVITDQAMPRMTGLQLAEALRAICRDLPVFLYTGYGHVLDGPSLSAAGVRSVLDKPVDPASLQAALSKVLAGNRSGQ